MALKFKKFFQNLSWKNFFVKLKKINKLIFIGNTRPRQMFNLYLYFLLFSTFLLMTPIATTTNRWQFIPALFTASSAFSDTGLTIKNTANEFSFFGQLIILFLIKFGGIGLIAVKLLFLSLFRSGFYNSSLKERLLVQGERGSSKIGSTMHILIVGLIVISITEFLGFIALFLNFYFVPNSGVTYGTGNTITYYNNFWLSVWAGVFHSISATNNAGFDIIGGNSLIPFQNNYFVQCVFILQFVIGGIGFPVFYDLYTWAKSTIKKIPFRFSLFTKITTLWYLIIAIFGVLSVLLIESLVPKTNTTSLWNSMNNTSVIMAIIFNTMSTRNAGFYTVDFNSFHVSSQVIHTFMMWVGSSPASTAGGIRTTTFAIIIMSVIAVARGQQNVNFFKRQIPDKVVKMSFVVSFVGTALIFITAFIILFENLIDNSSSFTFGQTLFTATSAFGTTGLTLIDNKIVGPFGKIALIILMFVGQLGVSTTILAWSDKKYKLHFKRVEEHVTIG